MTNENKKSTRVDYLDFDLEIGQGIGQHYPIKVRQSPAGEANEDMKFPFGQLDLENRLLVLQNALLHTGDKRRRIPLSEEQAVQCFGRALFEALFTGEIRIRYAVSQREAFSQGKGLRIKLRVQSPELAALPWEFLYDLERSQYISLSRLTPLVRYLDLPSPFQPLTITPPLCILGMAASPQNLPQLDIKREQERVERALEPLQKQVRLSWVKGQTWQCLQQEMRHGPYHVFHFIGHGGFNSLTDEGLIALSDEEGQANLLSATLLGRLLADQWSLRLVILNACEGARGGKKDIFSSTAAMLVQLGIPAVLAMQYEITDQAAIELSRAFYEALVDGMPVDAALAEARKAISFAIVNTLEWGTPVLYMRSPNGVLFHMQPSQPKPIPPSPPQPKPIPPSPPQPKPIPPSPPQPKPIPPSPPQPKPIPPSPPQPTWGKWKVLAIFLLLIAFIGATLGVGVASNIIHFSSNPTSTLGPTSGTVDVHMGENNFDRSSIIISVGSSINLINDTPTYHSINNGRWDGSTAKKESEAGAPEAQDIEFKTANQSHTLGPFNTVGTFRYYDADHPDMNLTVIVQ